MYTQEEIDDRLRKLDPDPVHAILFDLDGVILDSESVYTDIWNEIDRLFPTGVKDFSKKIKGSTLEKILNDYFPDPAVRKKVVEKLYEFERRIQYRYKPGAKEALEFLRKIKEPMALVTSSNEIKMSHVYEQLPEFKDFFDVIITGDMVRKSKPDPEGYALAAKTLKRDPKQCIVVEDSLQGVGAGKRLGAIVVGVAGTLPDSELQYLSDFIVESIKDFMDTNLLWKCFVSMPDLPVKRDTE